MPRIARLLFAYLLVASACTAWAEPPVAPLGADEAYQLTVVLRFSNTPVFSRFFIDRIRHEMSDHLRAHFGQLVNVQVVLFEQLPNPSAADVGDQDGSHELGAALVPLEGDELESLTAHAFMTGKIGAQVLILDFSRTPEGYQIRWRRWDGQTQNLGSVHEKSVSDRQILSKNACLAVCEGFSPVAIIQASGQDVKLMFQGTRWQGELVQALQLPCIMQAIKVEKSRDGSLAHVEIPRTVVVVTQGKNGLEFRPYSYLPNPWQMGSRVVRFEAIKISPARGRLTLRIQDNSTRDALTSCMVYANDRGFADLTDADLLWAPDRNGYVVSKAPLDRLAFVKITQGRGAEFLLPLVISSASVEETVRIPRDKAAGMKAEFERRMQSLGRDLIFLRSFHAVGVESINSLKNEKKYEDALARAESLHQELRAMLAAATKLKSELRKESESLKIDGAARFARVDDSLAQLENDLRTVDALRVKFEEVIKINTQRARADLAVSAGKASEQSGDYETAIENYEQALREEPNKPNVPQRLEMLKQAWTIKSPEHEKARTFVYETWADQDVSRLDEFLAQALPQAQSVAETLAQQNDFLTAKKFSLLNESMIEELVGLAAQMQESEQEEDRSDLEKISQGVEQLGKLSKQLQDIRMPDSLANDFTAPSSRADSAGGDEDADP